MEILVLNSNHAIEHFFSAEDRDFVHDRKSDAVAWSGIDLEDAFFFSLDLLNEEASVVDRIFNPVNHHLKGCCIQPFENRIE